MYKNGSPPSSLGQSTQDTKNHQSTSDNKPPRPGAESALPVQPSLIKLEEPDSINPTLYQTQKIEDGGMADGKNEARSLRILEIMNDFRTLQMHINDHISRSSATPPDQQSYYLPGHAVLRQCSSVAQSILSRSFNPGSLGINPGNVPDTEVQKANLQRVILDAATRRYQAHKVYLQVAAASRWISLRQQVLQAKGPRQAEALAAIDRRLREELGNITDDHVVNELRAADRRKNYWIQEDPSLERMLSWIRLQR